MLWIACRSNGALITSRSKRHKLEMPASCGFILIVCMFFAMGTPACRTSEEMVVQHNKPKLDAKPQNPLPPLEMRLPEVEDRYKWEAREGALRFCLFDRKDYSYDCRNIHPNDTLFTYGWQDIPKDLKILDMMRNLKKVRIALDSRYDLSVLNGKTSLENLDISNSVCDDDAKNAERPAHRKLDISPLKEMNSLKKLRIGCFEVVDLSPLSRLSSLKDVIFDGVEQGPVLDALKKQLRVHYTNTAPDDEIRLCFQKEEEEEEEDNRIKIECKTYPRNQEEWETRDAIDLSPLARAAHAESLDLNLTGDAAKDLTPIGKLTSLPRLEITIDTKVDLSPLGSLTNLEYLDVSSEVCSENKTAMEPSELSFLKKLTNLREVHLPCIDPDDVNTPAWLKSLISKGAVKTGQLDVVVHNDDLAVTDGKDKASLNISATDIRRRTRFPNKQAIKVDYTYGAACNNEDRSRTFTYASLKAHLENQRALRHHQKQRYREAAEGFEKAVELDPSFDTAVINLACAQALLGNTEQALATLKPLLEKDPVRMYFKILMDDDLKSLRSHPSVTSLKADAPGTYALNDIWRKSGVAYSKSKGLVATVSVGYSWNELYWDARFRIHDVKTGMLLINKFLVSGDGDDSDSEIRRKIISDSRKDGAGTAVRVNEFLRDFGFNPPQDFEQGIGVEPEGTWPDKEKFKQAGFSLVLKRGVARVFQKNKVLSEKVNAKGDVLYDAYYLPDPPAVIYIWQNDESEGCNEESDLSGSDVIPLRSMDNK